MQSDSVFILLQHRRHVLAKTFGSGGLISRIVLNRSLEIEELHQARFLDDCQIRWVGNTSTGKRSSVRRMLLRQKLRMRLMSTANRIHDRLHRPAVILQLVRAESLVVGQLVVSRLLQQGFVGVSRQRLVEQSLPIRESGSRSDGLGIGSSQCRLQIGSGLTNIASLGVDGRPQLHKTRSKKTVLVCNQVLLLLFQRGEYLHCILGGT